MKKILVLLSFLSIGTFAIAHTVEWYVDGNVYQTTTCNSGDTITPPTAPAKYGYTFDGWGLPYERLEYIESTGTQYIDTGQQFQANIQIYLDTMYLLSPNTFGWGRNGNDQEVLWEGTYFFFGHGFSTINEKEKNVRYIYYLDFTDGAMVAKINGSVVRQTTSSYGTQPTANQIYLFACNNKGTVVPYSGKVYSFEIKNNSVLVQYLIPVKRKTDNVVGMYDTVSGTFFTNAGTGEFIAGPEVGAL